MTNLAVRSGLAALVVYSFVPPSAWADETAKPNILVIVGDDMGYAHRQNRGGRRSLHERVRLRAILFANAGRPLDGPLPNAVWA